MEHKSDSMLPKKIAEASIEPGLVPNLDCKFVISSVFSCVITCGTLTETMKSSGVRAAQLLTVRAEGQS